MSLKADLVSSAYLMILKCEDIFRVLGAFGNFNVQFKKELIINQREPAYLGYVCLGSKAIGDHVIVNALSSSAGRKERM